MRQGLPAPNGRMQAYHHLLAAQTGYDVKTVRRILRMTETLAERKGKRDLFAHGEIFDAMMRFQGLY